MSKLKTRKSAAKRFKATATGKFMRRRAFHNHLLDHKSSKLKRHLSTKAVVDERDADNVRLMIPYAYIFNQFLLDIHGTGKKRQHSQKKKKQNLKSCKRF